MRALMCGACLSLSVAFVSHAQESRDPIDAQLSRIVEAARAKGLPTDPIVAKAQQGVVMRAPAPRIVAAAQAVAMRLEQARDALAPEPTPADIIAGQDALSIPGVTKDALAAVRSASDRAPVVVPVGVLAQLVASGVAPRRATEIVTTLVRHRATSVQLTTLGNEVNGDVAHGGSADASLAIRLRALTPSLAGPAAGRPVQALETTPTPPKKP